MGVYLRKISLEDKIELVCIEKFYTESFPRSERRPVEKMHKLMEKNPLFNVFLLENEDRNAIGFVTYWIFDSFIFLEHFAISSESRNAGYGKQTINALISETSMPLIGEIELPSSSEMAMKRLHFYERLGFKAWDLPYEQPPYEIDYEAIPMQLISYRDIDLDNEFDNIRNVLVSNVYNNI